MAEASDRYVIPNLRNACKVLQWMGTQPPGQKVSDFARALKLPATTALRIANTLALEGFLRRDDNRFYLGPQLIYLGSSALAGTDLRDVAQPVLAKLAQVSDETAHLAIPSGLKSLIVAVCDSPHPLRAASRPGTLTDLHCAATGKVFLTWLLLPKLEQIVAAGPLAARTTNTLVTVEALRSELERTRARGYSLDNEEFNYGVRCLAAPVFGAEGAVVAAIGITASALRFTTQRTPEMAGYVQAAAREVTALIGGRPAPA